LEKDLRRGGGRAIPPPLGDRRTEVSSLTCKKDLSLTLLTNMGLQRMSVQKLYFFPSLLSEDDIFLPPVMELENVFSLRHVCAIKISKNKI
jgi:hypothetical protein